MHFVTAGVTINPLVLAYIGFAVGVCGGFFGIGGAFLVTPALNILGFPMACAIGTDLAHITGKSVIAAIRHRRLGNVDLRAAGLLVMGTIPGVEVGARVVMLLERTGITAHVVRPVYVVVLIAIGLAMLRDLANRKEGKRRTWRPTWPPVLALPSSGIAGVSVWAVIGIGLMTGFLAGFLGVGGGFMRMPALLYVIGMPTKVAVGTDLVEVLFSGAYGTFTYARHGLVDLPAALVMLVGAAFGSQIGVLATQHVRGRRIRLYFAVTVLVSAGAVALKQMGYGSAAAVVLLSLGGIMSGTIIGCLIASLRAEGLAAKSTGGEIL